MSAIFKENELASSPLILHKANILCIDAITVLSYGKNFSSHYVMTLSRDNLHMSRDKCVLSQTLSDGTETFIFTYKS